MWVDTICCPQTPLGVVPSGGPRSDALKVPANVLVFFYLQIFHYLPQLTSAIFMSFNFKSKIGDNNISACSILLLK